MQHLAIAHRRAWALAVALLCVVWACSASAHSAANAPKAKMLASAIGNLAKAPSLWTS